MPSKPKDKPASSAKSKDLRKFLQREIAREQLKLPSDDPKRVNGGHSLSSLFMSTPEEDQNDTLLDQCASHRDVDSVFGEEILTEGEFRQAKLDKFLAETKVREPKVKPFTREGIISDEEHENQGLQIEGLKAELRELVVLEIEATPREKSLIMRQKDALKTEIGFYEYEEMRQRTPKRGLSRGIHGKFLLAWLYLDTDLPQLNSMTRFDKCHLH